MDIFIDPSSPTGLANQLYEEIRLAIVEGRARPGDQMPPSRELATTLGVSRHTVTTAYGRPAAEGYLDGRRGGGTRVADLSALGVFDPSTDLGRARADPDRGPDPTFDLRPGTPDPRLFPSAEWKRYLRWAVDQHQATYGDTAGVAELRLVLLTHDCSSGWAGSSRAVPIYERDPTTRTRSQALPRGRAAQRRAGTARDCSLV